MDHDVLIDYEALNHGAVDHVVLIDFEVLNHGAVDHDVLIDYEVLNHEAMDHNILIDYEVLNHNFLCRRTLSTLVQNAIENVENKILEVSYCVCQTNSLRHCCTLLGYVRPFLPQGVFVKKPLLKGTEARDFLAFVFFMDLLYLGLTFRG